MKQVFKIYLFLCLFWFTKNVFAQDVRYNIEYEVRVTSSPNDDRNPEGVRQDFGPFFYSESGPIVGDRPDRITTRDIIITSPTEITSYFSSSNGFDGRDSRTYTHSPRSCGLARSWGEAPSIRANYFRAVRIWPLLDRELNEDFNSIKNEVELCTPVRINVATCQSFYSLQYTDDLASDNWRTYTSYGLNQPFIDFEGSRLTGVDLSRTIWVRVRYTRTGDNYSSDRIPFSFLECPPFLENVEPEDATCFGANDGKVTFTLEENINADEQIRFFIVEGELPTLSEQQLEEADNTSLAVFGEVVADPIFTIPNVTPSYEITDFSGGTGTNLSQEYFAVYQVYNQDGTVSSAGLTESTFTIRRPSQITVQAIETSPASCVGENSIYTLVADGGYYDGGSSTATDYLYEYSINGSSPISTSTSLTIPATNALQTIRIQAEYIGNTNECKSNITLNSFTIPAAAPAILIDDDPSLSSGRPPSAAGLNDGSIQITLSEGSSPFDYNLESFDVNSGSFVEAITIEDITENNYPFEGLSEGRYRVRVSPANQDICSDTSLEFNLVANALPVIENIVASPPSCIGQLDGSITLDVNGGVAPLEYRWYDSADDQILGETTTTLENLAPGTYSFRAISSGGNFDTLGAHARLDNIIVQDAIAIQILNVTPSVTSCFDGADGSLTISVSGAAAYDYSLNGGLAWAELQNDNIIPNLGSGFYEVLLRNRAVPSCLSNVFTNVEVTEPSPITVNPTSNPATTNGGFEGSISIIITGGTPFTPPANQYPYNISWQKRKDNVTTEFLDTNLSTPYEINGLEAATYIPTITDANGCTTNPINPVEIVVDQPGPLSIDDITATDTCNGSSTGTITATVQGMGNIIFDFLLQPGEVGEAVAYTMTTPDRTVTASDLAAGTYGLRITEEIGGNSITTPVADYITINELAPITAIVTPTPIACDELNTGIITITSVAGGSNLGFEYAINDGFGFQDNNTFTGLVPREYIVTVRDNLGCEFNTTVDVVQSGAPIVNELSTIVTNASSSTSTDGTIALEFETEATNYTYAWTGPGVSGRVTKDLDLLAAGTYEVTVTAPGNCTLIREFTVGIEDALSIQSFTGTDTCFNQSNGSLTATIVAAGPVTFNWFEVNDPVTPVASETTPLRTLGTQNLGAGTYYLEIVDTNGVTVRSKNDVEIVELAEVSATVVPIATCIGSNTGSITFSNAVGSPSDSYAYSIDNGLTFQASPIFENLAADNYTPRVSITENNDCDFIAPGVVIGTSPSLFYDEPNTMITRASGPGANDGGIIPAFTGGTLPYSYLWNTGEVSPSISGLTAGTYSVVLTDAAGCSIPQGFEVTEVGPLTISNIVPTDATCKDGASGSITTTVTGEGTITYLWTLADGSPVPVSNGVNDVNLTGVLAGSYILTATDDNATRATAAIVINEPTTSVTITNITPTDISCFGGNDGALEILAAGGTGPYTFSINGGTFQTSPVFNTLIANSYSVRVRDSNDCEFAEPTPILLIEPQELNLIINEQRPVTAPNATNGAILITVEGGSDIYTYEWTGPNGFASTDEDILNLAAGDYSVTVTDANFAGSNGAGCRLTSALIAVTEPGQLSADLNQTVFLECSGDDFAEITANVQGGVTPYIYEWFQVSNGNNTLLAEDTEVIGNLSVGTYFIRVTDANTISIDSNPLPITAPTQVAITVDNTINVLCAGQPTGAINITVSGGTPPYQYFWSNAATVPDISGLDAGDYTIDVEDAAGCIAQRSVTITAPADGVQVIDDTVNNVSAYLERDGNISLDVSGGLAPYTYIWTRLSDNSSAGNQATISNLSADSYTVSISDSNGCTTLETYEVTQPDIVEETIVQPSCSGESDGSITVLANQGNGTFTYLWSTGANENSVDNLPAGSYTVTVTGFVDGPITRTYLLENPVPLEVNLGTDRVLCANQALELDATVDDATASYSWSSDTGFTSSEPAVTLTETGNYTVTVQSRTGCTTQGTIVVDISTEEIDAEFAMSSQAFVGETVIAVDISYPLPEGIEWIVPIGAEVVTQDTDAVEFSFTEAGEYEITAITTRGDCIAQKTKKILVVAKDGLIGDEDDKTGEKSVEEFMVYPNPTNGKFTVEIELTERGDVSVKVFSFANNALMASQKVRGETGYSIPFDISGMPSGVYAVLLETPYGTSLRKIVVR